MAFIEDLTEKSIPSDSDYLIVEDSEGTKKIQFRNLAKKTPIDIKVNGNNKIYLISSDGTHIIEEIGAEDFYEIPLHDGHSQGN